MDAGGPGGRFRSLVSATHERCVADNPDLIISDAQRRRLEMFVCD
jgi:hypothetical protein